jgi:hypothetical protein
VKSAIVKTASVEPASVDTALVDTALVDTALVAPRNTGTSCICGKIKKSNVLHYICHFTQWQKQFLVLVAVFSASLGLKMNIDSLSWPYGHLRLSNLSFPALVTLENNHSYQKLFPTLAKWQMNEVKYYFFTIILIFQ